MPNFSYFPKSNRQKAATVNRKKTSPASKIFANVEYLQDLDDADLIAVVGGAISEQIPLSVEQQIALLSELGIPVPGFSTE